MWQRPKCCPEFCEKCRRTCRDYYSRDYGVVAFTVARCASASLRHALGVEHVDIREIPEGTKVIAIIRDPFTRAMSSYRLSRLNWQENWGSVPDRADGGMGGLFRPPGNEVLVEMFGDALPEERVAAYFNEIAKFGWFDAHHTPQVEQLSNRISGRQRLVSMVDHFIAFERLDEGLDEAVPGTRMPEHHYNSERMESKNVLLPVFEQHRRTIERLYQADYDLYQVKVGATTIRVPPIVNSWLSSRDFYSVKHNVRYYNIPRNASVALRKSLEATIVEVSTIPDDALVLAVLRDPFTRAVSAFHRVMGRWLLEGNSVWRRPVDYHGIRSQRGLTFLEDEEAAAIFDAKTFEDRATAYWKRLEGRRWFDQHQLPQVAFLDSPFRGRTSDAVDEFLFFEQLAEDLSVVLPKVNLAVDHVTPSGVRATITKAFEPHRETINRLYSEDWDLYRGKLRERVP